MPLDYLAHVRSESGRFLEVLTGTAPTDPVPSCPGWTADDLLWHLTEVQSFWGSIVEGRLADPAQAEEDKPDRPGSHPDLVALFTEASERLGSVLGETDPSTPVWTWADDHTAGFVRRRQAHEALIHRVDAELIAAEPTPVDPALAADGADEILRVMIGGYPEWASFVPDGARLRLEASDADGRWGVAFGRFTGTSPRSGKSYDAGTATIGTDARDPGAAVRGSAADLDLWLWGRGPLQRLDVAGDPALAERLRALAVETTQ